MSVPVLNALLASRYAALALGEVGREDRHRLDRVLDRAAAAGRPRELHPVFHGGCDWHSCVQDHWLLATLLRRHPEIPEAGAIRALFDGSFAAEKIAAERADLARPSSRGFERPYGWAWLLRLQAALLSHDSDEGLRWAASLQPLAEDFAERFRIYLPKARYPVRAGTQGNTAFALALAQDYALRAYDSALLRLLEATARRWYLDDRDCQAREPSDDDVLSPALIEAECLRRLLPAAEFRRWFAEFLPRAAQGEPATLFRPAAASDRGDGGSAHLDGLNLSRAWCWRSLAATLADDEPLRARALRAADAHLEASLPRVAGGDRAGHGLASFALLALTA
ncbi:MAG: DUF2891 domain-containing protein [Nevskia sp.]